MKSRSSRSIFFLAALLAGTAAFVNADDAERLGGSWKITITAVEPAGLPPFKGLLTFTRDGEVLESRRLYVPFTPFGPVLETSGHGAWVRTGRNRFSVAFQFLLQAAPNNPTFTSGEDLGTDNIRMSLRRGAADDTLTGTFASEAKDAEGNVVFVARGTVTGSRILATPPSAMAP